MAPTPGKAHATLINRKRIDNRLIASGQKLIPVITVAYIYIEVDITGYTFNAAVMIILPILPFRIDRIACERAYPEWDTFEITGYEIVVAIFVTVEEYAISSEIQIVYHSVQLIEDHFVIIEA